MLASTWWTVLLFEKNESEYKAKKELIKIHQDLEEEQSLDNEYKRQKWMILGESLFLGGTLIAGMWLIYRGHKKEINSITQQNNFLLAITHELKSPISSIDLILQTLKSRKLNDESKNELIDTSLDELKRLEEMVENLLISAKNENSLTSLTNRARLSDIIFEMINELRREHPSIQLLFSSYINNEKEVLTDSRLFSIALKNIINNSIRYGENSMITVYLTAIDHFYKVSIADNGIGIKESEKSKIFNKFYRIGDEMTRQKKGSGLGLYIAKRVIQEHKGHIEVKDNLPKGTIFDIRIPILNE